MAQSEGGKLDAGDSFPELGLRFTTGENFLLPSALAGKWGILLLYRGHW